MPRVALLSTIDSTPFANMAAGGAPEAHPGGGRCPKASLSAINLASVLVVGAIYDLLRSALQRVALTGLPPPHCAAEIPFEASFGPPFWGSPPRWVYTICMDVPCWSMLGASHVGWKPTARSWRVARSLLHVLRFPLERNHQGMRSLGRKSRDCGARLAL